MKKFRFKLQVLLDHRRRIEDEKKKELAKVNYLLVQEQERLQGYAHIFKDTQLSLRGKVSGEIDLAEMMYYQSFLVQLRQLMSFQAKNIEFAKQAVEVKRKDLVEASKQKKIMEKLKENAFDSYKKESIMQEEKISDDLAMTKYIRNQKVLI